MLIGYLLVVIFIGLWYRVFGMLANVALFVNVIMLVALMSLIPGAALTLPGIAGIVLTVGMSVDANVLIFERIREELGNGNTPQASIRAGWDKAYTTIVDSNLTTLIAAIVLFMYGTGPIKGFAVTLSLGIATSMFTAITVTRALVNLVYGSRTDLKTLSIGGRQIQSEAGHIADHRPRPQALRRLRPRTARAASTARRRSSGLPATTLPLSR